MCKENAPGVVLQIKSLGQTLLSISRKEMFLNGD